MVVISFSVLLEGVQSGKKHHTIRKFNLPRLEQMARLGIQVYWKQRAIQYNPPREPHHLFNTQLTCVEALKFTSDWWPCHMGYLSQADLINEPYEVNEVWVKQLIKQEPVQMTKAKATTLAKKDGFDSVEEMSKVFRAKYGDEMGGLWSGITFRPPGPMEPLPFRRAHRPNPVPSATQVRRNEGWDTR